MFAYYVRLALRDFRRNPGITALMIGAIALGIAVCVMTMTVYRAMSGNPIWWKDDRLYHVSIDTWSPDEPWRQDKPELAPAMLTYRDATAVARSGIPARHAVMYATGGIAATGVPGSRPERAITRITSAGFFTMFDVPFRYGSAWPETADRGAEPVMVLSARLNDKLFGGENSVGRTLRWNDREYRIIGVLDEWLPQPKFYDLTTGAFNDPEDAYIPWGWGEAAELDVNGNISCWKPENLAGFKDLLGSECIFVTLWVELPDAEARERMQAWLDGYAREQKAAGRMPRPLNNRLTRVSEWLEVNDVVASDNRVLVGLSFAFLAVCLLNTIGLLLAKFLNNAAITGVRRALGASRRQVFTQHLVEVGVISAAGAAAGLGLGALLLAGLRRLFYNENALGGYQALAQVDATSIVTALALALVGTLAAGLYPAWRVGRLPPAVYLKSQ